MVLLLLAAGSALVQSPDEQKRAAQAELYRRHPDAQGVLADPAFGQWVAASPERVEMLRRAHEQFDVAAADALFTAWKNLRG
jgi:hypothetical protein